MVLFLLCYYPNSIVAENPSDSPQKNKSLPTKIEAIRRDTTFKHEDIAYQGKDTIIHKRDSIYRRALAIYEASSVKITNEALRAYTSPMTIATLLQETNEGYPLMLTDQGYGRESFVMTNRISEPLAATFLEGVLPLNDPLTGNSNLNYFPLEIASLTSIVHGGVLTSADHGSSEVVQFSLERFRAPLPYSRFHYTQELGDALSNFEGLFSINPLAPLNITLAVYHRSSGRAQSNLDLSFDPRVDSWWVRGQSSYETKAVNAILFMLYSTSFSGLNGGIVSHDSVTDIFDPQLATVKDPSPYDHKTRLDILTQIGLSLFSEKERTLLSGYATTTTRRILGRDSATPVNAQDLVTAQRYGFSLLQPAELRIGEFLTRATVRGDASFLVRKNPSNDSLNVSETRLSAMASDSLSLAGIFGVSISGYLRGTLSKLSIGGITQPDIFLPNFGIEASTKLTEAIRLTAQVTYARDRADLSPSPLATYELKNIGAFANLNVPLGKREMLSLNFGYLDRHEPEGVFLRPVSGDSIFIPQFSSRDLHTSSIRGNLDLWFSYFRYSLQALYFPKTIPNVSYTSNNVLKSDLKNRIQSSMGFYYENEIAEGNLRISVGSRVRYMSFLSPSLSYDPYSDYYIYNGLPERGGSALNDSRLSTPKYILDILVSSVIDQRATVNVSLLNILSTSYYNVGIYPRGGFQFRLDVTWAFLD